MASVYPPSPAPSACDSLADIEDLDAFLDAQGKLSHWPTPPPAADKKAKDVVTRQSFDDLKLSHSEDSTDDADEELWRLASAYTVIASGHHDANQRNLDHVIMVLLRAEVPREVLALAYNILRAVAPSADDEPNKNLYPVPDLAVTASLSLATTFMEDKAPDSEYWAREVCKGFWSAQDIDFTVLDMLAHPSLRMLTISSESAINKALVELRDITIETTAACHGDDASTSDEVAVLCSPEAPGPLKLAISDTVHWVHGVVTPAETPVVETNSFLRLL